LLLLLLLFFLPYFPRLKTVAFAVKQLLRLLLLLL
jgi:hypothetical protein